MKIPFSFLPASWGLKGKTRQIAEAEYLYRGYDLEVRLAKINITDPVLLAIELLEIDFRHEKISEYDYDIQLVKLTLKGVEMELELLVCECYHGKIDAYTCAVEQAKVQYQNEELALALLKVDYDYEKINQIQWELKTATIKKEPYIGLKNSNYNANEKLSGLYFEFEWNDFWIAELRAAGYVGYTEEQMVEKWFQDICKGIVSQQLEVDIESSVTPFNSRTFVSRNSNDDNTTSYS